MTPETARWADGLITIAQPHEKMSAVVDAFRDGGGERKPMILQAQLSYARSEDAAAAAATEAVGHEHPGEPGSDRTSDAR